MKPIIRVINLDGTEGVGKTLQCSLLYNKFSEIKPCIINHLEDSVESCLETIEKTISFLDSNENGLVINDGSIARMLSNDIASGMPLIDVLEKNRQVIHYYEVLCHKYPALNTMLICPDIPGVIERVRRKAKMLGISPKNIDPDFESKVVMTMLSLDNNVISRNLKFEVIEVGLSESIMSVEKKLYELISSKFDL